jgi:hypothetical protein
MSGRSGAEDLEDDFEIEDVVAEEEDADAGFDAGSDVRTHTCAHPPLLPWHCSHSFDPPFLFLLVSL